LRWPGGDVYKGEFKEGRRAGKGVMTFSNGDSYNGEWRNDVLYGHGTLKFANGIEYTGSFQDGKVRASAILCK